MEEVLLTGLMRGRQEQLLASPQLSLRELTAGLERGLNQRLYDLNQGKRDFAL